MRVAVIGQGTVGGAIADDLAQRVPVVRYSLESPWNRNADQVRRCDIAIVAVPAPTTDFGVDLTAIRSALSLAFDIVVIKSTIPPGTTDRLQREFEDLRIVCSPEFLTAASARQDAAAPFMNLIGLPDGGCRSAAQTVLEILPRSRFDRILPAVEAELIKYAHNVHGVLRIVFANLLYDLAGAAGASWDAIEAALAADPFLNDRASHYNRPLHAGGRGAGGACFPKDLKTFRQLYDRTGDRLGADLLLALELKNRALLEGSGKDLDILDRLYSSMPSSSITEQQ